MLIVLLVIGCNPVAMGQFAAAPSRHYLDSSVIDLEQLEQKYQVRRPTLAPDTRNDLEPPPIIKNAAPAPESLSKSSKEKGIESQSSVGVFREKALPWAELTTATSGYTTISIAELQQLAARHNPTLALLRQQVRAAQGDWVQVGLKPNPTLAYEAEEIGDGGRAGKHGLALEQEFVRGGKRRLDRSAASWEKEIACRRLQLRCISIENDVRARAYEVLAAQRNVAINRKLTEIVRQSVQAAEQLGKAGEVSKIDLLQIRAKANEAQASLVAAVNTERLSWKKLAIMIGLKDLQPHQITDPLDCFCPLDAGSAWMKITQSSPQIATAQARIQQARCQLEREKAERIPDITISGGIHYDAGERQAIGSFGMGLPLKIYDRNQGNIQKAQAELAAAYRELDRQVLLLNENFSERYSTLETAQKQIALYKERILPDVQEALELGLQGYRSGEYGYMDILSAQQLYLESQTQYIQALKDYALACVYLDGLLAEGGLDE